MEFDKANSRSYRVATDSPRNNSFQPALSRLPRATPRPRVRCTTRQDGTSGVERAQKPSAPAPADHRPKKHPNNTNKKSRTALAPIAVTNNGRDAGHRKRIRRAARSSRVSSCTAGPGAANTNSGGSDATKGRATLRVAAGVRDGRRKPAPRGAPVPALPVVPGWKAMAAGGTGRVENRKRTRRRPPKHAGTIGEGGKKGGAGVDGARGGASWTTDEFGGVLRARNSTADLERLLSTSAGGGRGAPLGPAAVTGEKIRALRRNGSTLDENTGAEEDLDTNGSARQLAVAVVEQATEESGESGGREQGSHTLAGDESLSMETLDAAFPVPEEGVESGGGGGLGETSAPGGFMSPGWSSRSSRRSSEAGETSSGALSDSAAIRHGKALLSGESAGRAGGWGGRSADGGIRHDADESAAASADQREEQLALFPSAKAGAAADDDEGRSRVPAQLPSAAFPDSVSDLSDYQTFFEQRRQRHDGVGSGDEDEGDSSESEGARMTPPHSGTDNTGSNPQDAGARTIRVESAELLAAGQLKSARLGRNTAASLVD